MVHSSVNLSAHLRADRLAYGQPTKLASGGLRFDGDGISVTYTLYERCAERQVVKDGRLHITRIRI